MKLEEIELLWKNDSEIKESNLAGESLRIPQMHSRWYGILMEEKLQLYKLQVKLEDLEIKLESYFLKTMTEEERVAANLPPFTDKKILRTDVGKNIDTYPDVIQLKIRIAMQTDKIDFLKDIIKMIHNRNFVIKNAIDVKRFEAGGF